MLTHSTIYLNGQFTSNDRAYISPEDRGFNFADGIYEVIKFYKSKPFCFQEHMERLKNNLKEIKIQYEQIEKLGEICDALININQLKTQYSGVYIQITRGVAARIHRFPSPDVPPTIFAKAFSMNPYWEEMKNGVMVLSREDIRWLKCNIKSIGLLPNTLLFEEVASKGAFECMLVRNGMVTEASHSNILAVKDNTVITHPDSNLILPGITKASVINICRKNKIAVVEEPIKKSEIYDFDEWFLTGTGSEIMPVINIDGTIIGNGKPGKVTRFLQNEFFKITYQKLAGEAVNL
jgi:D-alanine transaminase